MRDLAAWSKHLVLSLLAALVMGSLSYAAAQALTSAALLYQQQPFFQEATTVLREGDITALAGSRLHEVRQQVRALEEHYARLSLQAGGVAALAAALLTYLRLEWKAWKHRDERDGPDEHDGPAGYQKRS